MKKVAEETYINDSWVEGTETTDSKKMKQLKKHYGHRDHSQTSISQYSGVSKTSKSVTWRPRHIWAQSKESLKQPRKSCALSESSWISSHSALSQQHYAKNALERKQQLFKQRQE